MAKIPNISVVRDDILLAIGVGIYPVILPVSVFQSCKEYECPPHYFLLCVITDTSQAPSNVPFLSDWISEIPLSSGSENFPRIHLNSCGRDCMVSCRVEERLGV